MASGPVPLLAVMVNELVPAAVGVPEIRPVAVSKDNPAGNDPLEMRSIGVGLPLAVTVWL